MARSSGRDSGQKQRSRQSPRKRRGAGERPAGKVTAWLDQKRTTTPRRKQQQKALEKIRCQDLTSSSDDDDDDTALADNRADDRGEFVPDALSPSPSASSSPPGSPPPSEPPSLSQTGLTKPLSRSKRKLGSEPKSKDELVVVLPTRGLAGFDAAASVSGASGSAPCDSTPSDTSNLNLPSSALDSPDSSKRGGRKGKKKSGRTNRALANTSAFHAHKAIQRLREGNHDKSGQKYVEAVRNNIGCILVQKKSNHGDGYIQIAPPVFQEGIPNAEIRRWEQERGLPRGTGHLSLDGHTSPLQTRKLFRGQDLQVAQRLVVRAYKHKEEIERLLKGEHASHRCANRNCVNENHIVVEPRAVNLGRKQCPAALTPTVKTKWRGETIVLRPNQGCTCVKPRSKKCISAVEWREVERET